GADRGGLGGVGMRVPGRHGVPDVVGGKETSCVHLPPWVAGGWTEGANLLGKLGGHHPFPVVMHKRHGVAAPEKQWVTMTAEQFTRLLRVAEGVDTEPFGE